MYFDYLQDRCFAQAEVNLHTPETALTLNPLAGRETRPESANPGWVLGFQHLPSPSTRTIEFTFVGQVYRLQYITSSRESDYNLQLMWATAREPQSLVRRTIYLAHLRRGVRGTKRRLSRNISGIAVIIAVAKWV